MPRFAAFDLVLHCLPMSHKKDARLIWVKNYVLFDCIDPENNYNNDRLKCLIFFPRESLPQTVVVSKFKFTLKEVEAQLPSLFVLTYVYFVVVFRCCCFFFTLYQFVIASKLLISFGWYLNKQYIKYFQQVNQEVHNSL